MDNKCWICEERAEWRNAKYRKAINDAKELSKSSGELVAIIKRGPDYIVVEAQKVGPNETVLEFIRSH